MSHALVIGAMAMRCEPSENDGVKWLVGGPLPEPGTATRVGGWLPGAWGKRTMWQRDIPSEADTEALGEALAQSAAAPLVVALCGHLGAGKTCLARGVGAGLGVETPVVSPTFILVAEYEASTPLLHADVYRLEMDELESIGLEETLEQWPGLALVEWADRFPGLLPPDHLEVRLQEAVGGGRTLAVEATGPRSRETLRRWRARVEGPR